MANKQGAYGGYTKRPVWQWILIYLIVGGIVYGGIYYFVIAKNGGYNANNANYNYNSNSANYNYNYNTNYNPTNINADTNTTPVTNTSTP